MFLVELHLDVDLEVLLVIALKLFFTKLVNTIGRFTEQIRMIAL